MKRHGYMPALTTDNAKNIMNAGELAGMKPHIGCVAHTINLATQKGLQVPQMEKLLSRSEELSLTSTKAQLACLI